jgi:putative FmdB family regulatory protein
MRHPVSPVAAVCVLALAAAGCGSSNWPSSSAAAATASRSTTSTTHLAKTKFALHAGLAFGAFHHLSKLVAPITDLENKLHGLAGSVKSNGVTKTIGTLRLRVPKPRPILIEAMPIYEYRCEAGHTFEVMQRMSDDPVEICETCEAPVSRVFHPVAVHFKGSGFYNTDYGTRKRARENSSEKGEKGDKSDKSDSSSSSSSDSGSSSTKSSDSKSESKASSTASKSSD